MSGASDPDGREEQYPFSLPWVSSCYQQTLLPNAPWHKLESSVAKVLAGRVEKQFNHPQRKEMLLELLGHHFVDTYLSHVKRNPQVLDTNHMSGEEYGRLKVEASSWLNSQMYKAVQDTGLQAVLVGAAASETSSLPANYTAFIEHTSDVFSSGLDRHLYLQEQALKEEKERELHNPKKSKEADIFKVPAPSRLRVISTLSDGSSASFTPKPSTAELRGMLHTVQEDPPPMWGHQSDAIGAAVVSLLMRDPRKFDHVAGGLHGRQLPGSLRAYMWADVLFKAERSRMKEVYAEKVVRERFARAVSRGLIELKIKKPTKSPINGLIQNAVIETYSKTVSMLPYKHIEHLKEVVYALNVLYVFDRSYESYLVYWLFPLQIAFRDKVQHEKDQGEHVFELAMYLDLLNSGCFPTWPHVFAIAERVMIRLQQDDPELHDHLKHIATINVQGSPKEFLVQLIHQEREKAEALLEAVPNSARSSLDQASHQLLADPLIFLRRWIGEGFVSVLDTPGMMYIWDQCFMQCWSHTVLQNICLALLELLRHHFMESCDYIQMKEVFLNEACKLYTMDIQMAWIHVETGKHIMQIPLLNRQRPSTPGSVPSIGRSPLSSPTHGLLPRFGIKHFNAKIVIPAKTIQREQWLTLLDAASLRLQCTIYFGSIQLSTHTSTNVPSTISAEKDTFGNMVYKVKFPGERYLYQNFDLSQYDVERELGAVPYAILNMEYVLPTTSKSHGQNLVQLGWSRVPLFRMSRDGHSSVESFSLLEGETLVTIHPGDVPDTLLSIQPDSPTASQDDTYLGYNSEFGALVFDPSREPKTPEPRLPTPKPTPQAPPQRAPADTKPPPLKAPSKPAPTPAPNPPKTATPPAPAQSQPETKDPWVAYNPQAAAKNPAPTSSREPFDLFVDAVRYIPDNATIIKVTGRVLRGGETAGLQDILALPLLEGPARSPQFNFRMTINAERVRINPEMIVLLRVYTVDLISKKVVVIGSCLLKVFDTTKKKDGLLRVGGYQMRLHSGMPDVKQGIANLKHTDLDPAPIIPGCTLLVRLLPHVQDSVPAPNYSSGYYQSTASKPNTSEQRILSSYAEFLTYPRTERDMITTLQNEEEKQPRGKVADATLLEWLQQRLDIKAQIAANKPAENLNLVQCVRYRIKVGLNVMVNRAFNLPDGLYAMSIAQVLSGDQVNRMSPTPDNLGHNDPLFFTRLKPEGSLVSPQWEDQPQIQHPFYDIHSVLVVRLIGIPLTYHPTADHKSAGVLKAPDGQPLAVKKEHILGWTVVPLFDENSVQNGIHHVPIFRNDITADVIEELRTNLCRDMLSKHIWTKEKKHVGASLTVTIWDAHFEYNELPSIPVYTVLEKAIGDDELCQRARDTSTLAKGSKASDFVTANLPAKDKKAGATKGPVYQKEQEFFGDLASKTLQTLLKDAQNRGLLHQI